MGYILLLIAILAVCFGLDFVGSLISGWAMWGLFYFIIAYLLIKAVSRSTKDEDQEDQ